MLGVAPVNIRVINLQVMPSVTPRSLRRLHWVMSPGPELSVILLKSALTGTWNLQFRMILRSILKRERKERFKRQASSCG